MRNVDGITEALRRERPQGRPAGWPTHRHRARNRRRNRAERRRAAPTSDQRPSTPGSAAAELVRRGVCSPAILGPRPRRGAP